MCNNFASYFNRKISDLKSHIADLLPSIPAPLADPVCMMSSVFNVEPVSVAEVSKVISTIPDKSSPLDYVPTNIIKQCSSIFSELVSHLANLSFTQGTFPTKFKHASVTPLLKKPNQDPDQPSNYRPISNLNNVSKIIEKLFLSRLLPHITSSPNFNLHQSAYRRFYSTETSLTCLLDSVYHAADNGSATLLLSLDLSAAFDTIDHSTLLSRLQNSFGISGSVIAWLTSYLSDRSFSVTHGSATSVTFPLYSGVPQGSVLGPILFSVYTSPLASIASTNGVRQQQYADDTQLFISFSPSSLNTSLTSLQTCFSSARSWFFHNGLALNPAKTEAICMGTASRLRSFNNLTSVHIFDSDVPLSSDIKLLGVTLDRTLSFKKHISNICSSSYYHLRGLRRIRPYLDLDTCKTIALAIVGSRLDYANCTLVGIPSHNVHRLQRVQNSLARLVVSGSSSRSTELLASLHWLPVSQRISFKLASLVYQSLHGTAPSYLANLLDAYTPTRQLRSSSQNLLIQPRLNTVFGSRAFRSAGPRTWNSLPDYVKRSQSYASFRSNLKTHLFSTAFPTVGP